MKRINLLAATMKLTYIAIAATAITLLSASCSDKGKSGYKIVGTVEYAADGDTVFLESIENMEVTRLFGHHPQRHIQLQGQAGFDRRSLPLLYDRYRCIQHSVLS